MASIERTAYPRFNPSLTANELHALYCPSDDEREFISGIAQRPLTAFRRLFAKTRRRGTSSWQGPLKAVYKTSIL
jgi:hypothetical protein